MSRVSSMSVRHHAETYALTVAGLAAIGAPVLVASARKFVFQVADFRTKTSLNIAGCSSGSRGSYQTTGAIAVAICNGTDELCGKVTSKGEGLHANN